MTVSNLTVAGSIEMAQKLVETENIEFYVLVERMQEINYRLEKDTAMLRDQKEEEDKKMEADQNGLLKEREKQSKNRVRSKITKDEWLEKKSTAVKKEETLK